MELAQAGELQQLFDGVRRVFADDDGFPQYLCDVVLVQSSSGGEAASAVLANSRPVVNLFS
jgi:hypothetical protein